MEEEVRRRFEKIEATLAEVAARQAAAEVRADRADARMDRAEERMDRADARMDRADARMEKSDARFEKRMHGFEALAKIGMREIADLRRMHRQFAKETDEKINALIDSQQRTEEALRAFIGARRPGNGHTGGRKK
jgi:division protein CdvB (Snf7/Vps24/ESCRT-III family)